MPSFPIRSTNDLAEFLIPVTLEMATEIIAEANKANDGMCYAAVYYFTGTPDTRKRASLAITVQIDLTESGPFGYVWTDAYHPRTNGKADLVYRTEILITD